MHPYQDAETAQELGQTELELEARSWIAPDTARGLRLYTLKRAKAWRDAWRAERRGTPKRMLHLMLAQAADYRRMERETHSSREAA